MRPLTFLLALVMVLVMWGCEEEKKMCSDCEPWLVVCDVQIWMPTDTMAYLPGDSAIAEGHVTVIDCNGNIVPGVRVEMSLAAPFGFIEFIDPIARDTTDENGCVDFRFCSFNQTGTNIVRAECAGHSDQWTLVVREAAFHGFCTIDLSPIHYSYPDIPDSVSVQVCCYDTTGIGVPGFWNSIRIDCGHIVCTGSRDHFYCADCWWYFDGDSLGRHCLWLGPDTVCVTIDSLN